MRKIILTLFLMIGLSVTAQQSAVSYFNNGASEYVHSKLDKAIATVDEGLNYFPNDEKLNKLKEKLKEEKKKQDQQNKDQKNQDKKDQENKDQQNKDQKDKNEKDKQDEENKKKEEEKNKSDKEKEEEQKKQEEQDKEENKDKGDQGKENQPKEGQPMKMSPEQIKQLLETMNNEENKTQKKVNAQKVKKGRKINQEKDW